MFTTEGKTLVRKSKGFLALMVLFVAAAASGVALWGLVLRLPPPEQAGRRDLLRWVVTQDLSSHSLETRRALVRRLDETFGGRVRWRSDGQAELAPAQQARMIENVALLAEPWFLEKMEGYFALPLTERLGYVDRILDSFETWRGAERLISVPVTQPGKVVSPKPQDGMVGTILRQIEQCREAAPPEQRQKMDEFIRAVQARWLRRTLFGTSEAVS